MDQASYTTLLLSSVDIKVSDILNIRKSQDANKAHGHDDILIRMLKLSQKSILKPLKLTFENCRRTRLFPDQSKKPNGVPIHKNCNKQLIENYRPVSLLPICSKVCECLIFNIACLIILQETILFHCINQVLSLVVRVSNNLYLSLTRYITLLILTLLMKYKVCFWIFRLIRYGMMG